MALPETYQLLELIVTAMDCTVSITGISQVGSTSVYRITTGNTKWLVVGRNYTIGGTAYLVKDIVPNTSFDIELQVGQTAPTSDSFTIPAPFFYKGTYMFVNQERTEELSTAENSPFIYFMEPSRDRFFGELDAREKESECDLYFMIRADFQSWTIDKHYKYAIAAASNMKNAFMQAAKYQSFVGELDEVSQSSENHVKWGVYKDNGGHIKPVFNENLSGKKFEITLPFLKGCDGDCCDDEYNPPSGGSTTVENSDQSYQVTVDAGDTLVLPDEEFNIYVDGVLQETLTIPALSGGDINIDWE